MKDGNKKLVLTGMKDGIPIGLGYFAVAFSLGIAASNAGMNALQGFVMSFFTIASAGEYAGISAVASNATYVEMAVLILVANARYLLMSTALSQKLSPKLPLSHRIGIGFGITDEIFGINIAQPYPLNPIYTYGAYVTTIPLWAFGTSAGIVAGNILPDTLVYALSASIFGMFLAIVVPPSKKDRRIFIVVLASFAISCLVYFTPLRQMLSESIRIIVLTLIISAAAAIIFPREDEAEKEENQ
ncbi:MAG: AzlC family ABC transporter permease [Clostridia bacterium]|nr:AzlC family ABC transporter permease [Clostridia bacterium]